MRKRTLWHVRLQMTQISLHFSAVWSKSSLSAWRNIALLASQNAPSEDSDQTAHAQSDQNLHWAHISGGIISDVEAQLITPYVVKWSAQGIESILFSFLYNSFWKPFGHSSLKQKRTCVVRELLQPQKTDKLFNSIALTSVL